MHRTLPTLLALTLTALHLGQTTGQEPVQAPATQETAAQETAAQRLQGRWEVVRGVNQGKELTAAQLQDTYVTIATNTIVTYDRDQNERFKAVFTIDESKRPMEINMRTVLPNAPTRPAPDA
ncbi:MAG: hypothetical protein KDA45_16470, partial [Planctomycetales bacterium]|nr:hypothetical protein [Planctomycetales bacterium]